MKYSIQSETLTDIADAIRAKNGETERYTPAQMAQKIIDLPSGSSISAQPKDVNFFDYDGTLVYSYTLDEVQSLTALPTAPKHSGLVFQGWNWELEDIKALTRSMNIGAMYITDDGKTRLHIRIWDTSRHNVSLQLSQTVANGVTFDWGDGSPTETVDGTGMINISHTYTETGDYIISLTVADGCVVEVGRKGSYSGYVMQVGALLLQGLYVGKNVTSFNRYAFPGCYLLSEVTIPNSVSYIAEHAFESCNSLRYITFPIGMVYCYGSWNCTSLMSVGVPNGATSVLGFLGNHSLVSITIPDGTTMIGTEAFQDCYSLESIIIPASVKSIGDYAFKSCLSMAEYHLLPVTPPTLSGPHVFDEIRADCIIYVPKGSLETYQTATNWVTYADYMREETA